MNRYKKLLLFVPIAIYLFSYLYLAIYHGKFNLLSTVVHEGGLYTFTETMFYASHFLGHIPVHTVLAFFFVGVYACLSEMEHNREIKKGFTVLFSLILFLIFSWFISIKLFGAEDTYTYILQQKQSVVRSEQGGSWNLHFPSTIMQFLLIPLFIYVGKIVFQSKIFVNKSGLNFIGFSVLLCFFMTWLVNDNFFSSLIYMWENPRYLAHSVRELATFPLTYYPIPFYLLLKSSSDENFTLTYNRLLKWMIVLAVIFLALFAYQTIIPLKIGIGELAQEPSFAKGGKLSILYLLSSHYFEHFLDTIYFTLLCVLIYLFFSNHPDEIKKSSSPITGKSFS